MEVQSHMADMVPQGTQENGVPHGHESADANMRTVVTAVTVLLSSVAVVMLAMAGMFTYLNNREKAKDVLVPDTFEMRQLPPGPPLLPSPKEDKLPWAAYQDERRAQEAEAAKYGIINQKSGAYQLPGPQLSTAQVSQDTNSYFKSKAEWEQRGNRYTGQSSGGLSAEEQDAQKRFGTTGTAEKPAQRPGDTRELGPRQIKQ